MTTLPFKGTPGPWRFEKTNERHLYAGDGSSLMCDTQYYPWCPDKDEDWSLISAAYDLASLLWESRENMGGDWRERRDAALEKAGLL